MGFALIDVGDGTLIAPPPAAPAPPAEPSPPPPVVSTPAPSPRPLPGHPLIDSGDGPLIAPPPAAPAPPVESTPVPPVVVNTPAPVIPIPLPGHPLVDLGDIVGPPDLIPAPPSLAAGTGGDGQGGGAGGGVGDTADLDAAAAIANANQQDLSDLLGWELFDPFGVQTLGVSNPTLKGGGALSAIAQACSDFGVDTLAVVADALHEGASGGMGDGGLAYGPFQDHLTEFAGRPFYGKGRNNAVVNAWAWSENGIRYSVRQMASANPSARGLRGHPAVYAIVYGYERPADKPGAYKTRATEYDHLIALGSQWAAYAAPLFKGPAAGGAVDTTPIGAGSSEPYAPAGVVLQWRGLVDVFKLTVPQQRAKVNSLGQSLKEVFR